MRLVALTAILLSISGQQLHAQTDPQNVVGTFIASPVNGTLIDNRSSFQATRITTTASGLTDSAHGPSRWSGPTERRRTL